MPVEQRATHIPPTHTPVEAIRALGFDPEQVQAVIVTAGSAVAIDAVYPEPYNPPEA